MPAIIKEKIKLDLEKLDQDKIRKFDFIKKNYETVSQNDNKLQQIEAKFLKV